MPKTAKTTCPYHGSDLVKGKCPDCVVEHDGWERAIATLVAQGTNPRR